MPVYIINCTKGDLSTADMYKTDSKWNPSLYCCTHFETITKTKNCVVFIIFPKTGKFKNG